jgi:hypothetical protein
MSIQQTFLNEIEAFLERSGMTPSAFGKGAVQDPNFVGDLRAGRSPSLGLVERVYLFISMNEPKRSIKNANAEASA